MTFSFKRLFLSVLFLTTIIAVQAKVYLVSAGISDYPGATMDLRLPAKDAQTITWLYTHNTKVAYCQLLDSAATFDRILSAMRRTYAKALPNDIVVFFFSGHGYPGGFSAYDRSLPYYQIRAAMAESKCKNKMIFADACYSGQIRTNKPASQSSVQATQSANVMLFLSSRDDETSFERSDMVNGYFTSYLQNGLKGSADANRDRVITAKELYNYVHRGVIKISNGKQHPVMWGKFPDDMPVMVWNKRKK